MHIGRGEQLSKAEIMYIPNTSFYQFPKNNNAIEVLKCHYPKISLLSHPQKMTQQMTMMPPSSPTPQRNP
jgi:hypothetical protein